MTQEHRFVVCLLVGIISGEGSGPDGHQCRYEKGATRTRGSEWYVDSSEAAGSRSWDGKGEEISADEIMERETGGLVSMEIGGSDTGRRPLSAPFLSLQIRGKQNDLRCM
jgi:hypothetical protein